MKNVYVVMGNDFPEAVFSSDADAQAFCEKIRDVPPAHKFGPRIHWRVYNFVLDHEKIKEKG